MKFRVPHHIQMLFFMLAILLTSCILRCWNINQSFWWDEIWSTLPYAKADSVWGIFTNLGYYFNNHLLYSLLARGSISIFGESELSVRLPSLLMGLLGILVVFQFGRLCWGTSCGIIVAFLLAVSPFHIDHSSEARGYAGLALFSILSSLYFLKGLKTNNLRAWVLFVCFTLLGFGSHVFMVAVSVSQFFAALLFMAGMKWFSWKIDTTPGALRNVFICLISAGVLTMIVYMPLLPTFFENMGKVRYVEVTRVPFMLSVFNSFFPGIKSVLGACTYGIFVSSGMYFILRKDVSLFVYLSVLFFLPLFLYLLINPMFAFERYFIFALPFLLFVVSVAIVEIADNCKGVFKGGLVITVLLIVLYLQLPFLERALHQDRQNYREAVQYVERKGGAENDTLVFSIGYAGEHFRYYSSRGDIATPETLNELTELTLGKRYIWCLITAWLPSICPPYEDKALYAERSGQVDIFNYVKTNFEQIKKFPSRYPVEIHFWER